MERDISLTIVRTFKAAPEKLFQAWTDPEILKHWMAPGDTMKVALAETDPRVGGRYRIVMREAGGAEHKVGGVYREFKPLSKLVFTWAWEGSPDAETLVSVELRPAGSGTEMTLTHTKFATDRSRDMHSQGWSGCIAKLERAMAA